MVVDGTPGEEVEIILRRDMQATILRHQKSANVLRKAAEFSPAMGLIGTLIGLVQMLGSLDDPSTIGPSMAVALLTTFYGAVLANMVFSPLAFEAGAQFQRGNPGQQRLRDGGRFDRPAGKPPPPGNAVEQRPAAGKAGSVFRLIEQSRRRRPCSC